MSANPPVHPEPRTPPTRDAAVAAIEAHLGDRRLGTRRHTDRRVYLDVGPGDVPELTRFVFRELGARFQIASGIDTGDAIEILYHWAFDRLGLVVTLCTRLPREDPQIASLAGICKATEWIEREMNELLGIRFPGHPDPRRLLLPDDWPEGRYPLRRDCPPPDPEVR
jgi:Ni,Fe-hydrogenase III component G